MTDAHCARGREQPSGSASGRQGAQDRGVAHAPAPLRWAITRAKAAGKERRPLARHTPATVAATCWANSVCHDQRVETSSLRQRTGTLPDDIAGARQPPRIVAAPLAASAVPG